MDSSIVAYNRALDRKLNSAQQRQMDAPYTLGVHEGLGE